MQYRRVELWLDLSSIQLGSTKIQTSSAAGLKMAPPCQPCNLCSPCCLSVRKRQGAIDIQRCLQLSCYRQIRKELSSNFWPGFSFGILDLLDAFGIHLLYSFDLICFVNALWTLNAMLQRLVDVSAFRSKILFSVS